MNSENDGNVYEIGRLSKHGVSGALLYLPARITEKLNITSGDKSLVLLFDDQVGLIAFRDKNLSEALQSRILRARQQRIKLLESAQL